MREFKVRYQAAPKGAFITIEDPMYAVIRTGGKQYKVAPQDVLQIEKIEGAAGDSVSFAEVLMVAGEGEPRIGSPLIDGALVSAEVVEQGRGPKIIIFKKKRRQNYRRKNGHRQELTTVRILGIEADGAANSAAKASAKPKKSEAQATQSAAEDEAKKARAKSVAAASSAPDAEPVKKPRAPKKPAQPE
jgi:large subunit ribosomal protein L21